MITPLRGERGWHDEHDMLATMQRVVDADGGGGEVYNGKGHASMLIFPNFPSFCTNRQQQQKTH